MKMDFFLKLLGLSDKDVQIKIGTFGIMNNPEYRQEPWKESFRQRLECFDSVCVVCGHEPDIKMLKDEFPDEWNSGKLRAVYKYWSFPEWSYEELAKHLNAALVLAKEQECDWMVKLDIDTVFHEKDMIDVRRTIKRAHQKEKWLVSFGKRQFFVPTRYWKKSIIPLAVNTRAPIAYGFDKNTYTDLCQPIEWDGVSTAVHNGKSYDIPLGELVSPKKIYKVRNIELYNYDFTYRTYERSIELLYQIEMAHARFWGKGYTGLPIGKISRETSMHDFLELSKDRYKNMKKSMKIIDHPKHFKASLVALTKEQWGFSLWDKFLL